MFIQGDLQAVFDALYMMGAIDPVLKLDWKKVMNEAVTHQEALARAIAAINGCRGDRHQLVKKMNGFEPKMVNFIAMEVARELAEFTDRETLH